MIVTGVQPTGSRGVSAVQVATVDTKEAARAGSAEDHAPDGAAGAKGGDPQPVVFPRTSVGLDQRPVALRQQQASQRYREDGGSGDHDHDGD